eukprot:TRINITY_DN33219_c0_g1_i1.p1 TRINITY_DN33219_c0_g1~~TRINITY_DN33219_c0_g1_i1.p1  ORF type:complete len:376 (-),score=58.54 TRINITY_DN33219_c0_g1_i1:224-1261(-)
METHKLYQVSEFLTDRHPYLQEPFPHDIDPKEIALAFGWRVYPKLNEALEQPDLSVEQKRLTLVCLIAVLTSQEAKYRAIQDGVIEHVTELLRDEEGILRAMACEVLSKFTCLPQGKSEIVLSRAMPALNDLLSDEDFSAREWAALCFAGLSQSRDGVVMIVDSYSVMPLVDALNDENIVVVEHVLQALVNVTRLDAGLCMALSADVLTPAIRLLGVPELVPNLVCVICNLATHSQGKIDTVEAGAVEYLAEHLANSNADVRRVTASTMMHMAVCEIGKYDIDKFAAKELVQVAIDTNEDPRAVRNAKRAIRLAGEWPTAKAHFKELLSGHDAVYDEVFPNLPLA